MGVATGVVCLPAGGRSGERRQRWNGLTAGRTIEIVDARVSLVEEGFHQPPIIDVRRCKSVNVLHSHVRMSLQGVMRCRRVRAIIS